MTEYDEWRAEQAVAWLDHVRGLAHDVARLKDKVDVMRALALPSGIDYTLPKVSTSPSADAIPNAVARLIDSIGDYCAQLEAYVEEAHDADMRLSSIGDWRYRDVLIRYYVDGMSWREVGDRVGYVPDHCMRLRDEALPLVFDVMPREWRTPLPPAL